MDYYKNVLCMKDRCFNMYKYFDLLIHNQQFILENKGKKKE